MADLMNQWQLVIGARETPEYKREFSKYSIPFLSYDFYYDCPIHSALT